MPLDAATLHELDRALRPIAEAIVRGEAVFFPGNGMSMSVGAPSWEDLIAPLKEQLDPPTDVTDLQLIAQFYRNQHRDHGFIKHLRETFRKKALRPGVAHAALATLPVNIFLTTN